MFFFATFTSSLLLRDAVIPRASAATFACCTVHRLCCEICSGRVVFNWSSASWYLVCDTFRFEVSSFLHGAVGRSSSTAQQLAGSRCRTALLTVQPAARKYSSGRRLAQACLGDHILAKVILGLAWAASAVVDGSHNSTFSLRLTDSLAFVGRSATSTQMQSRVRLLSSVVMAIYHTYAMVKLSPW